MISALRPNGVNNAPSEGPPLNGNSGVSLVLKTADLLSNPVPENVLRLAEKVEMSESRVSVQTQDIFFREALPPSGNFAKGSILLLHGQAFSSANWLEHRTQEVLAAAGYRVVAVDLPGYGLTAGNAIPKEEKADFIRELIQGLNLDRPALVSPSMSGTYSLPFLARYSHLISAYIPVAPVGSNEIPASTYAQIQTPTLIIYGERDTSLGMSSKTNLSPLPNGRVVKVAEAGHAAYLNQPSVFQRAMINFLDLVRTHLKLLSPPPTPTIPS